MAPLGQPFHSNLACSTKKECQEETPKNNEEQLLASSQNQATNNAGSTARAQRMKANAIRGKVKETQHTMLA